MLKVVFHVFSGMKSQKEIDQGKVHTKMHEHKKKKEKNDHLLPIHV